MNISWEEYVDPPLGEARIADVSHLEAILGVKLPQDYKGLVRRNQGKYPSKETVVCGELSSTPFGPLFHIMKKCTDEQLLYSVLNKWEKWAKIYEGIVPIADSAGTGCFFAYDYRKSKDNPPVVFVDVEEDPDDDDAILYVANSLTEVIEALV